MQGTPLPFPRGLQRTAAMLSLTWALARLLRARVLLQNGERAVSAVPLGEMAQICMQDVWAPLPGARPSPAAVGDYALGPSAPGL